MIGKLIGVVEEVFTDHILINISGVCYIVHSTSSYNAGEHVSVYTEYIPREDKITIYGFDTIQQKELFNILRSVSGIAAKGSFNIVSTLKVNDVISAIISEDSSFLCQVNGIGKKVASRIINELKGKDELMLLQGDSSVGVAANSSTNAIDATLLQDASVALESLGFKKFQTYPILQGLIASNDNISVEELISLSLKQLG